MTEAYAFRAPLRLYPGESAWHFITLPVLPVKRAVRALAGVAAGDELEVRLVVNL